MPAYKGFNPMGPTDVKPWGAGDLSHEQDVINCLVMDTIGQTKNLAGHKHRSLYDGYGYQTLTTDDITKKIKMGAVGGDHKIEMQLGYGSPEFNIKRIGGASAFKWEESSVKATVGGHLDVSGTVKNTGDIYTQGWTNLETLVNVTGVFAAQNLWVWSRKIGNQITIYFRVEGLSTQIYFTMDVPFVADDLSFNAGYIPTFCPIRTFNNSAHRDVPGMAYISGSTITFMKDFKYTAGGDWTSSGNKGVLGMIIFTGSSV
jgi:hypothetical protein